VWQRSSRSHTLPPMLSSATLGTGFELWILSEMISFGNPACAAVFLCVREEGLLRHTHLRRLAQLLCPNGAPVWFALRQQMPHQPLAVQVAAASGVRAATL